VAGTSKGPVARQVVHEAASTGALGQNPKECRCHSAISLNQSAHRASWRYSHVDSPSARAGGLGSAGAHRSGRHAGDADVVAFSVGAWSLHGRPSGVVQRSTRRLCPSGPVTPFVTVRLSAGSLSTRMILNFSLAFNARDGLRRIPCHTGDTSSGSAARGGSAPPENDRHTSPDGAQGGFPGSLEWWYDRLTSHPTRVRSSRARLGAELRGRRRRRRAASGSAA
jgi:hypothetical protein